MKEAYYFSHDTNARNDEKILCLRADYGITGYGVFWILIEMMFENQDTQLSHKHVKGIAHSLSIDLELITDIINSCIEYGLFISDGECFWSESLRKRKGTFINKREKKVEAGIKSAELRKMKASENNEHNSNIMEQVSEDVPTPTNLDATVAQHAFNTVPNQLQHNSNTVEAMLQHNSNIVATKSNKEKESKVKEKEIFNSSPPKSEISEEGKEYANFFKGLLPPTQKVTEADLKNWADTFDKLVRIDKRSRDEIYQVTEWARKDSFWGEQGNFLSACKLRNKSKDGVLYYDMFLQKFNQRSKTNGTNSGLQVQRPAWITAKE